MDVSRGRQPLLPRHRRLGDGRAPRWRHLGRRRRDRDDGREPWSGMFVTLGAIDKAAHMWGAQNDAANFTGGCNTGDPVADGAAQTHVRAPPRTPTSSSARCWTPWRRSTRATAARPSSCSPPTTAPPTASTSTARTPPAPATATGTTHPTRVWDAGRVHPATDPLYNQPSPNLQPLIDTGNIQFSYQSTAIEAWLIDHSTYQKKLGASAMLKTPGRDRELLA